MSHHMLQIYFAVRQRHLCGMLGDTWLIPVPSYRHSRDGRFQMYRSFQVCPLSGESALTCLMLPLMPSKAKVELFFIMLTASDQPGSCVQAEVLEAVPEMTAP